MPGASRLCAAGVGCGARPGRHAAHCSRQGGACRFFYQSAALLLQVARSVEPGCGRCAGRHAADCARQASGSLSSLHTLPAPFEKLHTFSPLEHRTMSPAVTPRHLPRHSVVLARTASCMPNTALLWSCCALLRCTTLRGAASASLPLCRQTALCACLTCGKCESIGARVPGWRVWRGSSSGVQQLALPVFGLGGCLCWEQCICVGQGHSIPSGTRSTAPSSTRARRLCTPCCSTKKVASPACAGIRSTAPSSMRARSPARRCCACPGTSRTRGTLQVCTAVLLCMLVVLPLVPHAAPGSTQGPRHIAGACVLFADV